MRSSLDPPIGTLELAAARAHRSRRLSNTFYVGRCRASPGRRRSQPRCLCNPVGDQPFSNDPGPIDYYVIAEAPTNLGASRHHGSAVGIDTLLYRGTCLTHAAVGSHTLSASFASEASYEASDAPAQAFNIYANDSTISVSTSVPSLTANAAAGAVSDPVTLTVNSNYGATGKVSLACSGLPLGWTCDFSPAQVSLSEGGKAMTVMTIRATTATSAALFGVLFLLPAGLRRGRLRRTLRLWVMTAVSIGLLAGCSGNKNSNPQPATGTVTMLVSATLGSVTQTTPLQVTLR
jgi:hypothetical protein